MGLASQLCDGKTAVTNSSGVTEQMNYVNGAGRVRLCGLVKRLAPVQIVVGWVIL